MWNLKMTHAKLVVLYFIDNTLGNAQLGYKL